MKRTTMAFWSGLFLSTAIRSLLQDSVGLEGYIEHLRNHWVDASITVPLALVLLVVTVAMYVMASADEDDEDD